MLHSSKESVVSLDNITVLHVDDEPDFAEMAAELLGREDDRFTIQTTSSVSEAFDYLQETDVDCIVADYDMPDQDGIEFLKAVREDCPDLPFILYTGKGSEEVASEAISAGVTNYLQKGGGTDQYTILAHRILNAVKSYRVIEHIERQKAFTDDLLDAIEDVVYVLDTDGNLEEWNVALEAVTGYQSEAIESMNAVDFFAEEDADTVEAAVEESFETGRTRVELDFLTADDESIPYEFIANTFEDPTGKPVMAGIGRDRSVHVEYEATLEEQRDNLKVLNQVIRHDIRNDMTVVKGRANLLDEHIDTEGREHLEAVLRATGNAIELTKTARDLSETMFSTEEDIESVRIDQRLTPPIENARSKFDDAVITVEEPIPDVTVRGNDLLEAVFRNLIQNAVVHNDKESPHVEITATSADDTVTVTVVDNGPGVPDDQKETIFGKGEKRLDSSGTGIGLYLVQTLVEQYGGDVWVEDNDPEGSVFFVELPLTEATATD